MDPSITIAVCTRDRADLLPALLDAAASQLGAGDGILLIDQSEAPDRRALAEHVQARADDRIQHVEDAARGLPAGRNLAVSRCSTPVIWFIDDDVVLRPGALAAMRAAFADPSVGGAVGRIEERRVRLHAGRPRLRAGWDGRVRQRILGLHDGALPMLAGGSFAARVVALRAVGPCDAGFGGTAFLEDADWSTRLRRAGWRLRYASGSVVVHLAAPRAGCRVPDRADYDHWRFHNTAWWLRRHRQWGVLSAAVAFGALAVRAASQRGAGALPVLAASFADGWQGGADAPRSGRDQAEARSSPEASASSGSGYR